ncbi:MAG TPA: TolC family protein [Luteibaculaceae bacterium]|nr:TolC family protein [Luteibaculaceae bacterium]
MKKLLYLTACLVWVFSTRSLSAQKQIFTADQFLFYVKKWHPVAVQARIGVDMGESTVTQARGGFDPKLSSTLDNKYFKETEYYKLLGAGLKVPTWYGLELQAGYDQNSGVYLNPENNLPPGGLWYGGVSASLGQGLFIDQRRASLRQAQLLYDASRAERDNTLNDLLFDATSQYWKWVAASNQLAVFQEALQLANERFEATKQSFVLGDEPAIDTLESYIQLQNLQMNASQALIDFQQESLKLSNFLWYDNNTPLEVTELLVPPDLDANLPRVPLAGDSLAVLLQSLPTTHPQLISYGYKQKSLEIDRRLKAEYLKPKLNVKYNALTQATGNNWVGSLSAQNYKWGLDFSFPLFLRAERGNLQLAKLKIQDINQEIELKGWELENKLKNYFQQQLILDEQVRLFSSAVVNYRAMLDAERRKFETGESSIFLINTRQQKLIEAQLKLIELKTKYIVSQSGVLWAAGILQQQVELGD